MYVLLNDTLYLRISDSRVIIILVNHNVYEYYLHCKYYIILVRRRIRRSYYEPYLIKYSRSRYPTYLHSKHAEYILNFVSHKIGIQCCRLNLFYLHPSDYRENKLFQWREYGNNLYTSLMGIEINKTTVMLTRHSS
uniref:Uncharacterized protein n=1 Tax=Cacopsylla melanoneura TaxID=428564 RepID=A0A8D8VIF6_9HEMI